VVTIQSGSLAALIAYRRYRSRYPREILGLLRRILRLTPTSVIADIGSRYRNACRGVPREWQQGIRHRTQLCHANRLQELEASHSNLCCIEGTAEANTLPARSVDFVTAGRHFIGSNMKIADGSSCASSAQADGLVLRVLAAGKEPSRFCKISTIYL